MILHNVLIVDDYPSIRAVLKYFLEPTYGCNVHEAEDGLSGWEKALEVKPELIFTDVQMHAGLDGLQLLEKIRTSGIFPGVKIIVMSGEEGKNFQKTAYEKKADFFLEKPFDFSFLKELIPVLMKS